MDEQQLTLNGSAVVSKNEKKKFEKEFVEGISSIFRPRIVMPGYESMSIPEDLNLQITLERMMLSIKGEKLASETETLWYLSTASLGYPFDRCWFNIMMYLFRRYCIKTKKPLLDFVKENIILEEYTEERYLYDLRKWIYKKGIEAMK